ncbi:sulfatase-like hydrolase/transferase, partial [bacterium]|nr:sulfatase-like hydrolase/transferase [bacterium]
FIDTQIGRLLNWMNRFQPQAMQNTWFLFTSDHGDMQGDHHLWRKTYAYEASARIPMLVRWGSDFLDAKRGQALAQPVELRDVLPTFLDAAGATVDPKRFDGASLLDLIRGNTDGWREYIDFEHDTCYHASNHWNALTDGHVKYIFHAPDGEQQLFDLDADPDELHSLADDPKHAKTLALWRKRMIDHLAERGEPFVVNGDLGLRPQRMTYGPHYPRRPRRDG